MFWRPAQLINLFFFSSRLRSASWPVKLAHESISFSLRFTRVTRGCGILLSSFSLFWLKSITYASTVTIKFKSNILVTYLQELEVRGVLFQELDRFNLVRRHVERQQVWEMCHNLDISNIVLWQVHVLQVLVRLQIRNTIFRFEILDRFFKYWLFSSWQVQHRESKWWAVYGASRC